MTGAVSLAMLLAACGGAEAVTADGAWARTSPMMASAGAVYMDLTSEEPDRLIGASVDGSIAATTEVHETVEAEGHMGDEDDDGMGEDMAGDEDMSEMEGMGAMTMQEVETIELGAGDTVNLEPGGYHIMLLDLVEPLEVGDTFDVTLDFETADDLVVTVEVRDSAP
jgi:hypothetical protein